MITINYDSSLVNGNGAFIKPDGSIIKINTIHELFAREYCLGYDYDLIIDVINGKMSFDDYNSLFNYNGSFDDLNPFINTSLTDNELALFLKWYNLYLNDRDYICSDFLVQVLNWDKVETIQSKAIYTSNIKKNIRFYNYILMNWTIVTIPKLIYDENSNSFNEVDSNNYDTFSYQNRDELDLSYELSNIKKKVKSRSELELYFR